MQEQKGINIPVDPDDWVKISHSLGVLGTALDLLSLSYRGIRAHISQ